MKFRETPLSGSYLIGLERRADSRGSFARAFCQHEFRNYKLETNFVQGNLSENISAGTVRGMHFQEAPNTEVKLIRCIVGAIYDVIVDLRYASSTYLNWFGAELTQSNGAMMYVPHGFAHGYQSLTDGATAHYMVSAFYAPKSENGVRYNDPAINIDWPLNVTDISPKDQAWPLVGEPRRFSFDEE